MALADTLAGFKISVTQCDVLIANAHRTDAAGGFLFRPLDREQITVAAFLNLFIAWETFLESAFADLMTGGATIGGNHPVKYVSPLHHAAAKQLIIGVMRFFDYGNHGYVRKVANMYFQNGYPFEGPISAIFSDLEDLRVMRNASAHITSTTQTALESLALRVLRAPHIGITLYQLLTAIHPASAGGDTVFVFYKKTLIAAAELISNG